MSYYDQETRGSGGILPPFAGQLPNETFSESRSLAAYSFAVGTDLLGSALRVATALRDSDMARAARSLLLTLQMALFIYRQSGMDLTCVSRLNASIADDESILFEWSSPDYRIGFSIEPDPLESSWFLITSENLGSISASGSLQGVDLNRLTIWLLGFIVAYS